jgi:predicted CoA-substrate-specific enzyme activase
MTTEHYRMGIDIGSTTAKVVVIDHVGEMIFSAYQRHNAETLATLQMMIQDIFEAYGDLQVQLLITGSAGMGISERFEIPFIQEVVASAEVVSHYYPTVKTLIDIGGEDAKIIFFTPDAPPDIRMNGSCAGGTGAFIDEMAGLLNIPVAKLNTLAEKHNTIYPIASRCGVFAKTDVQNLLSREVAQEDIAASIFNAVVLQTLTTLSRGSEPSPPIIFSGGPLTFLPALRASFVRILGLEDQHAQEAANTELLPAIGAALASQENQQGISLAQLQALFRTNGGDNRPVQHSLQALFPGEQVRKQWEKTRSQHRVARIDICELANADCFLGVDSGSTTTKLVLVDKQGKLAFQYYCSNHGNPLLAVRNGLKLIRQQFSRCESPPKICYSMVTGYGEDLIRTAFGFDKGMVETLAHFRAARDFEPDVSFVLDIGGQDMKAIFVKDGHIQNIEINEACSSGCGTFIDAFARSTGYPVSDFGQIACGAASPYDLGTRCTVFMNSKVKQALREGAAIGDISAGLAYSVIKNALHKVLRITDTATLGNHILVQGGTFRNPAIQRAIEVLLDREVCCPDIAELMGAYGAALSARDTYSGRDKKPAAVLSLENLDSVGEYTKKQIYCHGCENRCTVNKLIFQNGNAFFTGNRCERIYNNSGGRGEPGANLPARKYRLLFDRPADPAAPPTLTLGIPRVLNLYENYPFWSKLFVECGLRVHLSAKSSPDLHKKGAGTVMSDNICYPAKLTHGHIQDLVEAGVDRIFYPMVFYEAQEFSDSSNCYNCPIISGYPDVIRSAIDPAGAHGIPLDMPTITFQDTKLLKKACSQYLAGLGVGRVTFNQAFSRALAAQQQYKEEVRRLGMEVLQTAAAEDRPVVLLLGRPYQIDPMINHKVPEILADFGLDVLTEDAVPLDTQQALGTKNVLTQWAYSNRLYHAARWAGTQKNIEVVFLNSFGCGPDAFIVDEVKSILGEYGKACTVIRIDEIESTGSVKLRLRTMKELTRKTRGSARGQIHPRITVKPFLESDQQKTIIVPHFSAFCSPPITRPLSDCGYVFENLPPSTRESVEIGLKYVNNEICYPGIVVIGDAIKALQSGKYDPAAVAIGFWETGGQCRASNILYALKRGLVAAGYENTPVVTVSTNTNPQNEQPGFTFNTREFLTKAVLGIILSDALSTMYHATAVREVEKGAALHVAKRYLARLEQGSMPLSKHATLETLQYAVADFNAIQTYNRAYPKVGIVGEIYLKYSTFGNNRIVSWLMDQGIEVIIPPLLEFFSGSFVAVKEGVRSNLRRPDFLWAVSFLLDKYVQAFLNAADNRMKEFRHYRPGHTIQHIADLAQEIVSLNHQYGEGWLIAGEISALVEEGVSNVVCLQPFGCIANHVVAKGMGKRIKAKHPRLNLLFLDTDWGGSEVNFFNRLHFFINHAKANGRAPSVPSV